MIKPTLKADNIGKSIDRVLLANVDKADKLFQSGYSNWQPENQPNFTTVGPVSKGGDRVVTYSTTDEPYVFVANGTPAHPITPKSAGGFLRFKAGSVPKTQPGTLSSGSGAPGTEWVTTQGVQNPGIKARQPQKIVAETLRGGLVRDIQGALK